jgi:tRNA(Ile)-lysidine synthase
VLSATRPAAPLGLAEFAWRLERLAAFERNPFVAVAVSGGPDSLALTILADRWARRRGGRICALSVDHGLRAESAAELRTLGGWLAARAIRHEVLVWCGEKPASRIQERARAARYRLLQGWCRRQGCLHLLTGHHRDDQIETFYLRRGAGSGPDGLAAMAAVRETGACRILRPLLEVPKERLVATLAAEKQPFLTDPSNRNPVFARARLRLGSPPAGDWQAVDMVRRLGRERAARECDRDALLARAVVLHPAGFAVLDPDQLMQAPVGLGRRALSALVGALGGCSYPPRGRGVARLWQTLTGEARGGHVLAGVRLVRWRQRFLVLRELAAAAAEPVEPGATVHWDGRFRVSSPAAAPPLMVRHLGPDGVVELHRRIARASPGALPRLVHPVLPSLWDKTGLAAVPALGYRREEAAAVLPRIVFAPVNCLSWGRFAVV